MLFRSGRHLRERELEDLEHAEEHHPQQKHREERFEDRGTAFAAAFPGGAEDGDAFTFGNYHEKKDGGEAEKLTVSVKDCKGPEYKLFKTKPFRYGPEGGLIWVCPVDRPLEEVSRIYVDQIFLIREGAPTID